MNAERLHALLIVLSNEMNERAYVAKMQGLTTALQRMVAQSNAATQQALVQSRSALYSALTGSRTDAFSPAWRQMLDEIGADGLVGESLKNAVESILVNNQITLALAAQEVQHHQQKLEAFKNAIDQGLSAFRRFMIGDETLTPGACEIGILIPRDAVGNQLREFTEELRAWSVILSTISEVVSGKSDKLELRTISSSELLVFLQAAAPFAACFAVCVERVVALYKQLLEIRKLRHELHQQGLPEKATAAIDIHAGEMMAKEIDKIVKDIIKEYYKREDKGRKHELEIALQYSLNKIANRIDRGFCLEVRVAPVAKKEGQDPDTPEVQKAITTIQSLGEKLQYLKLEGKPILELPEEQGKSKKPE